MRTMIQVTESRMAETLADFLARDDVKRDFTEGWQDVLRRLENPRLAREFIECIISFGALIVDGKNKAITVDEITDDEIVCRIAKVFASDFRKNQILN